MKITFLEGQLPLIKAFNLVSGKIQKTNYPNVRNFTSHTYNIRTIAALHEKLQEHADKGHCLLKGEIQKELNKESRAGSTSSTTETQFIVLDADGIPGINTAEELIAMLPAAFGKVSYIAQYSASMGITSNDLRGHIIMQLNREISPNILKQWLTRFNINNKTLNASIHLTRTKNSVHWPLDISVCQNDKLIFIAPPKLGKGVTSSFKDERIQLVKKTRNTLNYDFAKHTKPETLRIDIIKKINELRKAEGLSAKKSLGEKTFRDVPVSTATEQAEVTGIQINGDFTYLNLNGGDSWGYYYPTKSPDILYNFKGEPNYLLKELLPTYYAEIKQDLKQKKNNTGEALAENSEDLKVFAFINKTDSKEYRGTYNPDSNEVDLIPAANRTQVKDFFKEHDLPPPEYLPVWRIAFRPDEDFTFDLKNKRVNSFRTTELLKTEGTASAVPKTIHRIIHHACGCDDESYETLINWLAYIVQYRKKSGIAWILHGTQGTGKGILFNSIIKKIFEEYAIRTSLDAIINDKFNTAMEKALFCFIDEAHLKNLNERDAVDSRLREIITEPYINIRKMQAAALDYPSYVNIIMVSNGHETASIPEEDRRHSVAPRQEVPLKVPHNLDDILEQELPVFVQYLKTCTVDAKAATTPLLNEARVRLQEQSRNTIEEALYRITSGDFSWLMDNLPDIEHADVRTNIALPSYFDVLEYIYDHYRTGNISSTQVQSILYSTSNKLYATANQLNKALRTRGLEIRRVKIAGVAKHGLGGIKWQMTKEVKAEFEAMLKQRDANRKTRASIRRIK